MSDFIYNIQLLAQEEQAQAQQPETPPTDGPTADGPTADGPDNFEELIRGRYKEAFDARVQRILDGRLRSLRQENQQLRRQADAGLDAAAEALERLERDAGDIRAVYPEFQWQAELENPAFARLIGAGVDGRTAYEVVHQRQLLRRAMDYAARRAVTQTARSIASGARPVAENRGCGAAVTATDPRKLTGEELADIRRRVQNGEKIRF